MNRNKWIGLFTLFFLFSTYSSAFADVWVKGYYRKDGTYVSPHYRSNPDGKFFNNWSAKGNTNPYTGEKGTKTYLEHLEGAPTYSILGWSNEEYDFAELNFYEFEQQGTELQQQYEEELNKLRNTFQNDQEGLRRREKELEVRKVELEQKIDFLLEELGELTYTPNYEPYQSPFETVEEQEVDYLVNAKSDDYSFEFDYGESGEGLSVASNEDESESTSTSKSIWWKKILVTIKRWLQ